MPVLHYVLAVLLGIPNFTYFTEGGEPLAAGKIYVYSDRPVKGAYGVTYWDKECRFPNTNPVLLDTLGRAAIYIKTGDLPLRIVIRDYHDRFLKEYDDVRYMKPTAREK